MGEGGHLFRFLAVLAMLASSRSFREQAGCATLPDTAQIQVVGRFSDMRYTEEHAYGYNLRLWRAGGCVFGLLEASDGLSGDTPAGRLTNVSYTPSKGRLGFTVKLTTGVTNRAGSKEWVPSQDLFVFTGHLTSKAVEGKLRRSDRLRPDMAPVESDIVLPRVPDVDGFLNDARIYEVWRERAESILRFRGPKW